MKEQNTGEADGLFSKIENAVELINKTIGSKNDDIDFLEKEINQFDNELLRDLLGKLAEKEKENIQILKKIKKELE